MRDEQVRPRVTLETSILGGYPDRKKVPTHWHKKFGSKRLQWQWMQEHMPEGVEVCKVIQEKFGKLADVKVWIKKKGTVDEH